MVTTFTDEQTAGLNAEGTTLMIAAAGSGKTRCLTTKIVKAIKDGTRPDRILAITFTQKAAQEMKKRVNQMMGYDAPVAISTIHSACYRILREDLPSLMPEYRPRITAIDPQQSRRLIEPILTDLGIDENPWAFLRAFSACIANGITFYEARDYLLKSDINNAEDIWDVWEAFVKRKQAGNEKARFIDFDDMIALTAHIFRTHPSVARKHARNYDWVMVDEYQDTDLTQIEIVKALAEPHHNLFLVGDPRQLIYSWRGAKIQATTKFTDFFPWGKILNMTMNFRSTTTIIDRANHLIRNAEFKVEDCCAHRQEPGDVIYLGHLKTEWDESREVVRTITELTGNGRRPGDVAILYRTNAQSEAFESSLLQSGIPYIIRGSAGFYGREEVKDIVAYLAAIYFMDNKDDLAMQDAMNRLLAVKTAFQTRFGCWERILNRPNRFLGKEFSRNWAWHVNLGKSPAEALLEYYPKSYMMRNASQLYYALEDIKVRFGHRMPLLVKAIRDAFNYDEWVVRNAMEDQESDKKENLATLQARVEDYEDLKTFLVYAATAAKPEAGDDNGVGAVQLMTVHRSKGAEFPVVFVVGLSEGTLPHWKSFPNVSEERRIAYVAITRAKDLTYCSGCELRAISDHVQDPSRFLLEMRLLSKKDYAALITASRANRIKNDTASYESS